MSEESELTTHEFAQRRRQVLALELVVREMKEEGEAASEEGRIRHRRARSRSRIRARLLLNPAEMRKTMGTMLSLQLLEPREGRGFNYYDATPKGIKFFEVTFPLLAKLSAAFHET